ncbi:glycosyltransferase [uncultured Desulfobacter sp.]|uniref:glycosyltransferase n=1 Tax=uncultured Desulfobacter sp. TaxID=240139 RepID=UPI002AAA6AB0|nr:glycosyltransferase [uncultured Desulfobacter sp.]
MGQNITALIVTHNRLDKLKKNLSRTLVQDFHGVVVINCGSTDGTKEYLDNLQDSRLVAVHIKNIGGAGGFSFGARWLTRHLKTDWVVFFDDDAMPDKNLIDKFRRSNLKNYHAIACHVWAPGDLLPLMNTPVKRYPYTFGRLLRYLSGRKKMLISPEDLNTRITPVEAASFAGFFIRFDVLQKTWKAINADLFIYYDDIFYTLWLHKSGYRLVFIPQLKFFHDVEQSNRMPAWKIYFLARNIFSLRPLCSGPTFPGLALLKLGSLAGVILKNKIPGTAGLKLFITGILDGMVGNFTRFGQTDPIEKIIRHGLKNGSKV